jgi:hypothetical protein
VYSLTLNSNRLLRAALAVALGAIPVLGAAQNRIIPSQPGKSLPAARVMSTYDFNPQINSDFNLQPGRVSENNSTPFDYSGDHANTLKTGKLLSSPRNLAPRVTFPGIGPTGYIPPDCDMGVGPQHIVCGVNTKIAFFRKSDGLKQFEQEMTGSGFFSQIGAPGNVYSDPKVLFDPQSQRWIVCILEIDFGGSISKVDLAVSDDNNPNGNWFQYGIDVKLDSGGTSYWMDYPSIGCSKDAIAISGNMFGFSSGYYGASVVVIPKAPLLTGGPATTKVVNEAGGGTIQICRTSDVNLATIYGIARGGNTSVKAFAITNGATNPVMTITPVTVPTITYNNFDFAAGGGHQLDGFDSRIFTASWRNGKMVAAHSVAVNGVGAVRWYQLATNNWPASGLPTLAQSGDIAVSNTHLHMPGINVNAQGDIALTYTRSSGSINADLMISSRKSTDTPGAMGAPVLVKSSPVPYGGNGVNRWGDYFQVAVDPTDNSTFWGFGETGNASGNWTTWMYSWVVSTPGGSVGTPADSLSISTILGEYTGGDLTSIANSDNSYYTVASVLLDKNYNPPGSGAPLLGQLTEVEGLFQINPTIAGLDTVKLEVESKTLSGVNGMVYFYNWGLNRWDYISSFSMSSIDKKVSISMKRNTFGTYIDGTRQVKVRVRAINPVRNGRPTVAPLPFTFSGDQIRIVYTLG